MWLCDGQYVTSTDCLQSSVNIVTLMICMFYVVLFPQWGQCTRFSVHSGHRSDARTTSTALHRRQRYLLIPRELLWDWGHHSLEQTHFSCLYLWSYSFLGSLPWAHDHRSGLMYSWTGPWRTSHFHSVLSWFQLFIIITELNWFTVFHHSCFINMWDEIAVM